MLGIGVNVQQRAAGEYLVVSVHEARQETFSLISQMKSRLWRYRQRGWRERQVDKMRWEH